MLKLARLLMLIAVASLAAGPVMACCVTGHAPVASAEVTAEAAPCHGHPSSSEHEEMNNDPGSESPLDCPGCLDCETSIMQAQSFDDGALLSQISPEISIATLAAKFSGFEYKPLTLKTGPPGDPPVASQTPITLKQRLLI